MINKRLQYKLLRQNTLYSFIDGIGFSIILGAAMPYIGLYILRFGGSPGLVNWAASLQPAIVCAVALFGASYTNALGKKKPDLVRYSLILRLFFLLIAFVPFVKSAIQAWMFFILWLLAFIPWGMCGLLWSPMISTIIPSENQGRFFGNRNTITGITTLLATFFTGMALAQMQFSTAFVIIFLVSFICTMISLFFLNKHREPLVCTPGSVPQKPSNMVHYFKNLDLKANFEVFKHPTYGYLFTMSCIAVFIFHIGFSMTGPLYTLRQVKQLGLDNGAIATIVSLTSLTGLCGSYIGGIGTARWGYRYVLLYSTLLASVPPVIWAVTDRFAWLIIASMFWGLVGNAYFICFFYMVLAVSPDVGRARFVAMNTVIGNVAGAIGPFLGMLLTGIPAVGIQGALIGSSVIMLIGAGYSYQVARKGCF